MSGDYSILVASDVSTRDGLGVELYDKSGELVAEIFRDDIAGVCTFNVQRSISVPMSVLEWFVAQSHKELGVAE
jgi:hypothetical protein